jgi:hypothetical protein
VNIIEQVKDAASTEEMRAELFRLAHYDALVRAVMDMANYHGLSSEDRYTELAYYAMKSRNEIYRDSIRAIGLQPVKFFVDRDDFLFATKMKGG